LGAEISPRGQQQQQQKQQQQNIATDAALSS
jgi:hypothetical protein